MFFSNFVSFQQSAIFLKGQDDYFFYEWLEEVCGDRIQPFMLYKYSEYLFYSSNNRNRICIHVYTFLFSYASENESFVNS